MLLKYYFSALFQFLLCRYKLQLLVGNNMAWQKSPILPLAILQVIKTFALTTTTYVHYMLDISLKNPLGNLRKLYSVSASVLCVDE